MYLNEHRRRRAGRRWLPDLYDKPKVPRMIKLKWTKKSSKFPIKIVRRNLNCPPIIGPGGVIEMACYNWTFGDGGSSTSQNPFHTYSSAGSYTLTLTVSDGSSAKASATVSITVRTVSDNTVKKPAQKIIRQKKLYR